MDLLWFHRCSSRLDLLVFVTNIEVFGIFFGLVVVVVGSYVLPGVDIDPWFGGRFGDVVGIGDMGIGWSIVDGMISCAMFLVRFLFLSLFPFPFLFPFLLRRVLLLLFLFAGPWFPCCVLRSLELSSSLLISRTEPVEAGSVFSLSSVSVFLYLFVDFVSVF